MWQYIMLHHKGLVIPSRQGKCNGVHISWVYCMVSNLSKDSLDDCHTGEQNGQQFQYHNYCYIKTNASMYSINVWICIINVWSNANYHELFLRQAVAFRGCYLIIKMIYVNFQSKHGCTVAMVRLFLNSVPITLISIQWSSSIIFTLFHIGKTWISWGMFNISLSLIFQWRFVCELYWAMDSDDKKYSILGR